MKIKIDFRRVYKSQLAVVSLVVVLSLLSLTAMAQKSEQKLTPDAALPRVELILPNGKPRVEHFISYILQDGKRQNLSFLTRTLETIRNGDGQLILRVVQRYEDASGMNVDTSEMLLRNLLPVSYRAELAAQAENFEFSPGKVKGKVTAKNGEAKDYDIPLEETVYNAVALTELVQALPLAENYAARFRAYNPGKQFLTMTARVAGSEKLNIAGGKTIDAWLVRLEGGYAPVTYWIAKGTQEQIKQKVELKNGGEFWRVRLYE